MRGLNVSKWLHFAGTWPVFVPLLVVRKYSTKSSMVGVGWGFRFAHNSRWLTVHRCSQFQMTTHHCGWVTEEAWDSWSHHICSHSRQRIHTCMRTCLVACLYSAQFLCPKTQFSILCLGNGAPHSGLGLPASVNFMKATLFGHAHKPIIPHWDSLPGEFRVCQDGNENQPTYGSPHHPTILLLVYFQTWYVL